MVDAFTLALSQVSNKKMSKSFWFTLERSSGRTNTYLDETDHVGPCVRETVDRMGSVARCVDANRLYRDRTTMTQHDDSANQAHDDAAPAERHTMTKMYLAWHRDNCRCEPADTNDADTDAA